MPEDYVFGIEGGHVPCHMPLLRLFEIGELGRLRREKPPVRSIMESPKFSGQESENILDWLEHWDQEVIANGWSPENKTVMFP